MLAPVDLSFRPLTRADFPVLCLWIAAPHVAQWWREDPSPSAVERAYGPAVDGQDPTEMFVVALGGRDVGFVQRYLLDDHPDWSAALGITDAAGIDYLLGETDVVGTGVGSAMVDAFTLSTLDRYPDTSCVAVAVQQANGRSWRALENGGYERIFAGILESPDPSDDGPSFVYVRRRPSSGATTHRRFRLPTRAVSRCRAAPRGREDWRSGPRRRARWARR